MSDAAGGEGEARAREVVPPASNAAESTNEEVEVRSYGDVVGEYEALRHSVTGGATNGGAIVVDRSSRSRATFGGAKAREVLAGLVTNDVVALRPGEGCYAAALTPKGKIIADVRVFVRDDDVVVDVPRRAAPGWWAMIRKYVNPRLSRYSDVSGTTADVSVYGTRAHSVVAAALGISRDALSEMHPFAHRTVEALGERVLVARVPDLALEGFALVAPRATKERLWHALVEHGARPAGADAFDIARMESGRAEWGIEIDDTTLAQEANMDALHAISYTKGCYTGQETVARVHFRGHVNRHLRGLRFDEATPVPVGAELRDKSGKAVGEVRSSALSPRLGGIALAMVRREVEDGTEVSLAWDGGDATAVTLALPFPAG